jgi:hypothetical protein
MSMNDSCRRAFLSKKRSQSKRKDEAVKSAKVSQWIVGFYAAAIGAAGAVSGCSSGGNDQPIGEAGAETTVVSTGTDEVDADASAPGDGGGACLPVAESVATIDSGGPVFGCYQTACASELRGCAADCVCNGAITSALACVVADAGSAQSCFYPPILRNAANTAVRAVGTCLQIVLTDGGCERQAATDPPADN